ncbi:pentapeptide repeat-containing protein [Kriegella aquimaris]|uniref:Uncharacterized protein YjbI, contains pentapeptide repeats n=1 Tax=Kriegella aquimaris TaxID=192904 RepID=A0A1G9RCF5_9FLAO|nr:pentapeptide repeat-containing protein [Kriegella aquimaris]SDM20946.1 Uncharacterized protein YjbI, contains pentapeptide repeats [Kriegella aquimaris]
MSTVFTDPQFKPKEHGFHFRNSFKNSVLFGEIAKLFNLPFTLPDWILLGNPITTSGRCGGMTFSALDFFLSKRFSVPEAALEELPDGNKVVNRRPPPDGDVLADYIMERQFDSFLVFGDEYLSNVLIKGKGTQYYNDCLPPYGHHFNFYKDRIKANQCRPLGLMPAKEGSLIGHIVLGIGYTDHKDPEKVLIHIYDNNNPDQEIVLKLNQKKGVWESRFANYDKVKMEWIIGKKTGKYIAWIPADGYTCQEPDIYDNAIGIRNYSGRDLRKWQTPSKEDLTKYRFVGSNFFGNQTLESCDFRNVHAEKAVFSSTNASNCNFTNAYLHYCDFTNANLRGSTFNGAELYGANFSKTELSEARFDDIQGDDKIVLFIQAKLNKTCLNGAHISGNFIQASIAESSFLNAQMEDSHFITSLISMTAFNGSNLDDTYWRNATLNTCKFINNGNIRTSLRRTDFNTSAMKDCYFQGANLFKADFRNAAINAVAFTDCDLRFANFSGAALKDTDLSKANLSYARFDGTAFHDVDFRFVTYARSSWKGASVRKPFQMSSSMYNYLLRQGVKFIG